MPDAFLPFTTRRLVLRAFRDEDAAALASYRDDPRVARYQDWELPYTHEMAAKMIAEQAGIDGPVPGEWAQVAIERGGRLVGDVGIGLHHQGGSAVIGYTIAQERQGLGFAGEAVAAVIDRLFTTLGVHRIRAAADPANLPSQRLLEGLGFRFEGIARRAEWIRGQWCDDARYELLRTDHQAWLARPRLPPAEVALVRLTRERLPAVADLATFRWQEQFVAPMAWSMAEALVPEVVGGAPVTPWYRAVEADGEVVAFVMLSEVTAAHPLPILWRLLVDRRHQRRGIGARVVRHVAERLRAQGAPALLTSWNPAPGTPEPFFRKLGFVPTGTMIDDEVEAVLDLTVPARA